MEKAHQLICYGFGEITKVHRNVTPEQMKKFFPEADFEELKRPDKIELLISHWEGRLTLQRLKIVGGLILWNSPFGKTVAGVQPDLFAMVDMTANESKTHFAWSMRAAADKYEEIFEKAEAPSIAKMIQRGKSHDAETKISLASNHEFLEWWR